MVKQELHSSKVKIEERRNKFSPLTLIERKTIFKLIKKGYSLTQIAIEIGRGKNSVIFEVRRNGGRDKYEPIIAEQLARDRKIARDLKCSDSSKGKDANPYIKLRNRIDNIEMQLEIIAETLKEMKRERN